MFLSFFICLEEEDRMGVEVKEEDGMKIKTEVMKNGMEM